MTTTGGPGPTVAGPRSGAGGPADWLRCEGCGELLYRLRWEHHLRVCPECRYHARLDLQARLDLLLDVDGREPIGTEVEPVDILGFVDVAPYSRRLADARSGSAAPTPRRPWSPGWRACRWRWPRWTSASWEAAWAALRGADRPGCPRPSDAVAHRGDLRGSADAGRRFWGYGGTVP